MLKVFLSQPMRNRSKADIERERHLMMDQLPSLLNDESVLEIPMMSELTLSLNPPVCCLGLSIQDLSNADITVFAPGWRDARGCVIEHAVCLMYDLQYVELQKDSGKYYISKDGRKNL